MLSKFAEAWGTTWVVEGWKAPWLSTWGSEFSC